MKGLVMAVALVSAAAVVAADDVKQLPIDQQFLVKATECTIAEIKFADTAIQKASSAEVKDFAKKVRTEHNDCLKELMDQAKKHKLAVVEGLDKEHREMVERLSKLEGKAFDQEYIRGVIERHQKAVSMLENQNKDGKVDEIKALSKDALPKLKAHLEEARRVQDKIK